MRPVNFLHLNLNEFVPSPITKSNCLSNEMADLALSQTSVDTSIEHTLDYSISIFTHFHIRRNLILRFMMQVYFMLYCYISTIWIGFGVSFMLSTIISIVQPFLIIRVYCQFMCVCSLTYSPTLFDPIFDFFMLQSTLRERERRMVHNAYVHFDSMPINSLLIFISVCHIIHTVFNVQLFRLHAGTCFAYRIF